MCASASMASRVHPTLNQGMLEFCFPSEQLQIEMYFSSIQGPLLLDGWQGAVTRSLLKIIDREEALTVLGIAFCHLAFFQLSLGLFPIVSRSFNNCQ